MKPFADASFVVSFCADDMHTPRVRSWFRRNRCNVYTSRLALFEAENTIHRSRASGRLNDEQAHKALENLKRSLLEGFIELWEVPLRRLYPSARRLSQHHNQNKGYGALDILPIASALDMRCDTLLTFDSAQAGLVRAEGLKTAL
jgi:predicted nucleic acid-binding protein